SRSSSRWHTAAQRQRTFDLLKSIAAGSRSEDQRWYVWYGAQRGDVCGLSRRDENRWASRLVLACLGAPRSAERLHYGGTGPTRRVDPCQWRSRAAKRRYRLELS